MSYPVGDPPSGAYVEGTVADAQGQSEDSIRNGLKQQIKGFGLAQTGFGGLFAGIAEWLGSLNAIVDEQVTQAGEITEGLTDLENRVELLEGGAVTVRTYVANSVWTKPPNLIRLGVAVEGGGHAGRTGSTSQAYIGGTGGLSGGYRFQWFELAAIENDIAESVAISVGGGGEIPSQLGGVSRFGDHLASVPGVGAVLSVEGSVVSNSACERGGQGGRGSNGNISPPPLLEPGEAGGSSAFAAGGAGGAAGGSAAQNAGGDGQDAVLSPVARGNGGGGGGGGGVQANGAVGGKGGNGGYPAGPGGGGGARGTGIGSSDGAGGLGADGRVTVIEYTKMEE